MMSRSDWLATAAVAPAAAAAAAVAAVAAIVGDNTKGTEPTPARLAAKVWFAVDVEAHAGPTAEPVKQD